MTTSPDQLPIVVIACKVFESLLQERMPEEMARNVQYLDYGLHRVPAKLTWAVQEAVDSIEEPSLIMLGYGLCGNGLDGIKAGKHTLLIARADDCIAMLLGSYKRYIEMFEANPGTYYLTKGWLESGSDPLKEYREYVEKYGEDEAQWIQDTQYQHYEKLVLVAHTPEDLEKYRPQALEVAEYCKRWDWKYEEVLGSDLFVRRLIEVAQDLDLQDNEFVVVPPGGELKQSQFIR